MSIDTRDNILRSIWVSIFACLIILASVVGCRGTRPPIVSEDTWPASSNVGTVTRKVVDAATGKVKEIVEPTRHEGTELKDPTGRQQAKKKFANAASVMGWVAGTLAFLAIVACVLSFLPWFSFIPRAASFGCLAAAWMGWIMQFALLVYGTAFAEIAIWVAVAVVAFIFFTVGVPYVLAFKNWALRRTAARLVEKGHIDAAVAMEAVSGKHRTSQDRKERVRELEAAANVAVSDRA